MKLRFQSSDAQSFVAFSQQDADTLAAIMLALALKKEWSPVPFSELLQMVRSPALQVHSLSYDAANSRQYYSLVVSMLGEITTGTVASISMVHRWERTHPNEPIQDLPPLIKMAETEFQDVSLFARLLAFLAIAVGTGQGFNIQSEKSE